MIPSVNIAYTQDIPLEIHPGLPGVALTPDSTTGAAPVALPAFDGDIMTVYVDGPNAIWFALGGPNDQVTLTGVPVPPGGLGTFSLSPQAQACTHIIARTRAGSSTATVNFFRRGT